jgi:uncharacterized membrane protein (UPF0136 family)
MRPVNRDVAVEVFLYGLILTIAGFIGYSQKTNVSAALLGAAVIGGIVITVLAMRGHRVRTWCVATASIILLCSLTQAAFSWYRLVHDPSDKGTPAFLTFLCLLGLVQLSDLVRK